MEELCPECKSKDIVELGGYFITETTLNIVIGPRTTKYVCRKCGRVIGEKIDPKEINGYRM